MMCYTNATFCQHDVMEVYNWLSRYR